MLTIKKNKINLKGLRKTLLKIEYEKFLLVNSSSKIIQKKLTSLVDKSSKEDLIKHGVSQNFNYKVIVLRTEPLKTNLELNVTETLENFNALGINILKDTKVQLRSKCLKKNIFKKVILDTIPEALKPEHEQLSESVSSSLVAGSCKYMYWVSGSVKALTEYGNASSKSKACTKEHLIQLNLLKACIRAEPREGFLGCLLECNDNSGSNLHVETIGRSATCYKYYYPSQILSLCDLIDKLSLNTKKATGLEPIGHLLQTIESSVNSISTLLALKSNIKKE
jgi:hypothetical protein